MNESLFAHIGIFLVVMTWTFGGFLSAHLLVRLFGKVALPWIVILWAVWQVSVIGVLSEIFPSGSVGGLFLGVIYVLSLVAFLIALAHLAKRHDLRPVSRYRFQKNRDKDSKEEP